MKNLVDVSSVDGYLEPFCGACSVLVRMNDKFSCSASDYHPDLIELSLQLIQYFLNNL